MLQIFSDLRVSLVNFGKMNLEKWRISRTGIASIRTPHNSGEHEDTNEDDGAVEDDDNHDREQTVGWQTLERCLCELFECSELEDV